MPKEYIEREAIIKAIKAVPDGNWRSIRYAKEVEKIPAADVRPVVYGEWFNDDLTGLLYCSHCRADAPLDTTGPTQYRSHFCPNCGADMRQKEDIE